MNRVKPVISVIIPFAGDERANPKHLASWAKQRRIRPDEFEIVVGHQTRKIAIEEIRGQLRPGDTCFSVPDDQEEFFARKEMALYRQACMRARGDYVLLTEDHVIATPFCLSTIMDELSRRPGHDGFALGCGHINRTVFSKGEAAIYNQSIRHWYDPTNWDRVRQRGTLIRKELMEKAGGVPENFGLFGELLLSMKLWKIGAFIEHLPSAFIRHINLQEVAILELEIENFISGEIDYLTKATAADTAFFGVRESTRQALFSHPSHLGSVRKALASFRGKRMRRFSRHGKSCISRLRRQVTLQSYAPEKVREWTWFIRKQFLKLGVYLSVKNPEKCQHRMRELWNRIAENAAFNYVGNLKNPFNAISINSARQPGDLPALSTFGFHAMESAPGCPAFRWTSPVSGVYLDLADPGTYQFTLELAPFRHPASSVPFIPFFDGAPLEAGTITHHDDRITMMLSTPIPASARFCGSAIR